MKKYKQYKELDAATFDNSMLPLKNCAFKDKVDDYWGEYSFSLIGIHAGNRPFIRNGGSSFEQCAEIIEHYPRDVPEGVTELPPEMPQLAYVPLKKYIPGEFYDISEDLNCYAYNFKDSVWKPFHGKAIDILLAIDVSKRWAAENFPEIVEAMEYKAIYDTDGSISGHKLDSKFYDVDWENATKLVNNLSKFLKNQIVDGNKKAEEEPPDFKKWKATVDEDEDFADIAFEAGKARGKWEATQWKYETIDDYMNFIHPDNVSSQNQIWELARELKGGSNED